jgi:hypothetical protein
MHRMIGPVVLEVRVAETRRIILVGATVGEPLAVRSVARQVHGEGDVATVGPGLGPFLESRAPATVHEDHGGHLAVDFGWAGEVSEYARRLAFVRLAFVVERGERLAVAGGEDFGNLAETGEIPGTELLVAGQGRRGLGEEKEQKTSQTSALDHDDGAS